MKRKQRLDNSEESPLQNVGKSTTKWMIQTDKQDTSSYKKYTTDTVFNSQPKRGNISFLPWVNFQVAIPLH